MNNSSVSNLSTSTIGHSYLDNLPDLIYYHLLKYLDLDERWQLRLVSKKFYDIIKSNHIPELFFLNFDIFNSTDNWFSTTRPTRPEYRLHVSKLSILNKPTANLLNLKYLRINYSSGISIKIENLNRFVQLQILEIFWPSYTTSSTSSDSHLLQLPHLKALSITFDFGCLQANSLVIDAPNLHSLNFCNNFCNLINNVLKINHPLSVKYLRLKFCDKEMSVFSNLECLDLQWNETDNLNYLKASDLLEFKNLKKLKFNKCYSMKSNKLKNLFKSKKNDLDFFVNGVRIKEIRTFDELNGKESILEFQMKNYGELADDLYFVTWLSYNELMRLLPDNQLTNLFSKYNNVQELVINSEIADKNRLVDFITGCHNLYQLRISESSLDQEFYDRLPVIKSLAVLRIKNEAFNLDFEFLLKFPYLEYLDTDQDVQISKKLSLNYFKRLGLFYFEVNKRKFYVRKSGNDMYSLDVYLLGKTNREYFTHTGLIKWSNSLRSTRETRSASKKRKICYLD